MSCLVLGHAWNILFQVIWSVAEEGKRRSIFFRAGVDKGEK
jgi:hypothetical protein